MNIEPITTDYTDPTTGNKTKSYLGTAVFNTKSIGTAIIDRLESGKPVEARVLTNIETQKMGDFTQEHSLLIYDYEVSKRDSITGEFVEIEFKIVDPGGHEGGSLFLNTRSNTFENRPQGSEPSYHVLEIN